MGEKADVEMEMAGNPIEPYIESLRQQLEEQDPVFLIALIVALAVVVITCGKLQSVAAERCCCCVTGKFSFVIV